MDSVTRIRIAWALRRRDVAVDEMAEEVGRHRATVYRWIAGIELYGIEEYVRRYKKAKRGRRVRQTLQEERAGLHRSFPQHSAP